MLPCIDFVESEHRLVWTDAACIDQSNIQECGGQVKLMRRIYPSAAETIVFLSEAGGEPNLVTNLAGKLLDPAGELPIDAGTIINSYRNYGLPSSGSKTSDGSWTAS